MDGRLFAVGQGYTIGGPNGPQITEGKALEIQLGGYWIAGHIEREGSRIGQPAGIEEDTVEEASEESFPASDPPAWSRPKTSRSEIGVERPSTSSIDITYHFVADTDGNVCGLYPGMRVRTR